MNQMFSGEPKAARHVQGVNVTMWRRAIILLGGIIGTIAGAGIGVAATLVLLADDDKGGYLVLHSAPLVAVFLGILGLTAGATWAADRTESSKTLKTEN